MRAYTVKDGVISNVAIFKDGSELPTGWTEVKNGEAKGWFDNGSGVFAAPKRVIVEKTILEQINELENSVTKRNLRGLRIGDQWAINKVAEIDAAVELLGAELRNDTRE